MLAGVFNLSQTSCVQIGAIYMILEGTQVVPPLIVHLVAGFVKNLPHKWAEGCPPLSKRWTPAPAMWPHQQALWKWRVMIGSRMILSWKRHQALASVTPQPWYIRMSPQILSEMNPFIRSRSNDRSQFIIDVGIFTLILGFCFPLRLPISAIAPSWKSIFIRGVSIMIQLYVAVGSTEWMYKVVYVIRCVLEREALFCARHLMSW